MNCEQMNAVLSAFLDGELTAREQAQMNEHLERCPECRALFEQLQELHTSFSDLEEIPAPENFAQGVMSRIKAEEKPKVVPLFKRPQLRAVMGLAACAVLCIGFGRVALDNSFKSESMAAPEAAAPEAVAYDLEEHSVAQTTGGDIQPRTDSAPMESAECPVPELSASATVEAQLEGEKQCEGAVILLDRLPEGAEETIGPLLWEERVEDGALCARLTADQAAKLKELAAEQGLSAEESLPADGEPEWWMLVLRQ